MADNLDAQARLRLEIEGLDQAIRTMDRAIQAGDDLDKAWGKVQTTFSRVGKEAKGVSTGLKEAASQTKTASTGWGELDKKVRGVADAYKLAAREAIAAGRAAPDPAAFAAGRGVSATDIGRFRAGSSTNLLSDLDAARRHQEEMLNTLPRLRYALYDVATTAGVASTAITGVGVAAATAFSSMESSFTNVERTLDGVSAGGVERLREELVQLTREIPLTFADVSKIATLGNQLGIASGDIAAFTETTAKFSAVTGLTAEAAAQAFGGLGELLNVGATEYENLGSAIALVGRRSVATEQEIVAMTQRLAASATNAGFTAQEVVALSGAFASLRIAPERAQGVMEVYFNRLNTAINEGGDRLDAFAAITGESAEGVARLAQSDPVGLFRKLALGLGQMNQQAQTGALEQLGLDGIRAGEVFGRVSANVDVFNKALTDSNQGWTEGTELGKQYALVVDDLASKWRIFLNAVQEAGAAVGAILAPFIAEALRVATDLLQKFAEFAQTPFGGWVVGTGAAIAGLVAIVAGLTSALALASASFLAIRTALGALRMNLGLTAGAANGASGAFLGLAGSTGVATGALRLFRGALMATGIGAVLLLIIGLMTDFEGTMHEVMNVAAGFGEALSSIGGPIVGVLFGLGNALGLFGDNLDGFTATTLSAFQAMAQGPSVVAAELERLLGMVNSFFVGVNHYFATLGNGIINGASGIARAVASVIGPAVQPILSFLSTIDRAVSAFFARFGKGFSSGLKIFNAGVGLQFDGMRNLFKASGTGGLASAVKGVNGAMLKGIPTMDKYNDGLGKIGGGPGGGGGNAGGAAKAVRTLLDYANDLSGVMKRAFDLRFGNQQGLDSVTSGWQKIASASASARDEVAKYQQTLAELSADRQIKRYWLMVAENYGDELRAAKLRAELAELDQKQADAKKDLTKAQDKASMALEGNSEAAIQNRADILGMVTSYQDLLRTYAANGMSQQDLQRKAAQLKQEFIRQAIQMGYNRSEVLKYAKSFDDMSFAIAKIPRNVTVAANVNPAIQALNEFAAKARSIGAQAGKNFAGGFGGGAGNLGGSVAVGGLVSGHNAVVAGRKWGEEFGRQAKGGVVRALNSIRSNAMGGLAIGQANALKFYKTGGYTGNGGVNDIAGLVHGKEYVFSAPAVRNAGGPNALNFLHNMLKTGKAFGPAGGAPTGGMVELSPVDRALLMEIASRVGISIDGRSLQATVYGGSANFAQRRGA